MSEGFNAVQDQVERNMSPRHGALLLRRVTGDLLYAPLHRHSSTYQGFWYTSCGALAGKVINSAVYIEPFSTMWDKVEIVTCESCKKLTHLHKQFTPHRTYLKAKHCVPSVVKLKLKMLLL